MSCLTFGDWTRCCSRNTPPLLPHRTRAHPPHQHRARVLEQVTGSRHMHAAQGVTESIIRFIACLGGCGLGNMHGGGLSSTPQPIARCAHAARSPRCVCLVISDVGVRYLGVMFQCFPLFHNAVLQFPLPCCRVTAPYPRLQLISYVDDSWPCDTVTVAPSCRGNFPPVASCS